MTYFKNSFEKTAEAVVTHDLVAKTKELNNIQRRNNPKKASDKFFEKTSSFGAAALDLPLLLIKEFSLARLNSYFNIILFGFAGFWSGIRIKQHLGNFFMLIIPVLILTFASYKILQSIMTLSMVFKDTERIKKDVKNNFKTIPIFIVKVYRSLVIKMVDINWMAITFYVIGGLFILLPTLLDGTTIPHTNITFQFTDLGNKWGVFSMVKYTLVATLLFQGFYIFWVKSRINTINHFYGYEIVPNIEVMEIRKLRNARWRRVLTIIIFAVFIVFIVIYKFLRRQRVVK